MHLRKSSQRQRRQRRSCQVRALIACVRSRALAYGFVRVCLRVYVCMYARPRESVCE